MVLGRIPFCHKIWMMSWQISFFYKQGRLNPLEDACVAGVNFFWSYFDHIQQEVKISTILATGTPTNNWFYSNGLGSGMVLFKINTN